MARAPTMTWYIPTCEYVRREPRVPGGVVLTEHDLVEVQSFRPLSRNDKLSSYKTVEGAASVTDPGCPIFILQVDRLHELELADFGGRGKRPKRPTEEVVQELLEHAERRVLYWAGRVAELAAAARGR